MLSDWWVSYSTSLVCFSISVRRLNSSFKDGVVSTNVAIPASDGQTIPARIYRPQGKRGKLPLYISFHGGGFYFGNLDSDDVSCRLTSVDAGVAVLSVNYRHTPEWTYPTAHQDAWDAFDWICNSLNEYEIDEDRILLGGISAGANLACATALRSMREVCSIRNQAVRFLKITIWKSKFRIRGVILTVPTTVEESVFPKHFVKDGFTSLEQNANAPVLPLALLRDLMGMYKPDPASPYISPLLLPDKEIQGFPKTVLHVAGWDVLRDEGLLFEEKLRRAG